MGQKTHPNGLRLGVIRSWNSKWFEEKKYAQWLQEDLQIRKLIKSEMKHAGISKVEIERRARQVRVGIHTARPGILIGPKGKEAERLKAERDAEELRLRREQIEREDRLRQEEKEAERLRMEREDAERRA